MVVVAVLLFLLLLIAVVFVQRGRRRDKEDVVVVKGNANLWDDAELFPYGQVSLVSRTRLRRPARA
jgi:L-asparagine transporter-like permease